MDSCLVFSEQMKVKFNGSIWIFGKLTDLIKMLSMHQSVLVLMLINMTFDKLNVSKNRQKALVIGQSCSKDSKDNNIYTTYAEFDARYHHYMNMTIIFSASITVVGCFHFHSTQSNTACCNQKIISPTVQA